MSIKSAVLEILENHKNQTISGEEIAKKLNVSRNAVWKAVKELRNSGYEINSLTNKGYTLTSNNDILSAESINSYIKNTNFPFDIKVFEEIDSTNTYAKELALKNAPHGTVIVAKNQTNGRGRLGRSFFCQKDGGLYMSLIIKPDRLPFDNPTLITIYTAVMVCLAIETVTGIKTDIKWVNDLYYNGKKICGILTEAINDFESKRIEWIVTGMGINLSDKNFPVEISEKAASLPDLNIDGLKNRLAAAIIENIFTKIETIPKEKILEQYKKSLFILGQEIEVLKSTNSYTAKAIDIDHEGGLVIEKITGEKETLTSGEISIIIH